MRRAISGGKTPKRGQNGFTLLELLLVCAIIIITAATVSVSMGGLMTSSHLRGAASRVSSLAVYARSKALTSGKKVVMKVDPEAGEISLLQPEEDSKELTVIDKSWQFRLPGDVAIDDLEIDNEAVAQGEITFHPEGGAQAARIVLGAGGEDRRSHRAQRVLTINKITGRVKAD